MAPSMICRVVELTGYAGVRHVDVSVPLVPQLLDGKRYFMNRSDLPRLETDTERRRQRAPRMPSLRRLVRLAMQCQSAEELGLALKRRYQRQQQRQGMAPSDRRRDEAEFAERLHATAKRARTCGRSFR